MLPETRDKVIIGILIAIFCGIVGTVIGVGYQGSNDNANEKKKNISIIAGVSAGIMIAYTIAVLVYFSANPAYTNLYLIAASSFSILLSICAVSIATLSL